MSYLERAITDGHAKLTGEGKQQKILYVAVNHTERYADPEEQVRAGFWAELIYRYGYEPARIGVEITVPDRTPSDQRDSSLSASTGERAGVRCRSLQPDERKKPYAVIECKADGVTDAEFNQAVEQACGNGTWAKFRANYVGVVAGMTRRLWFLREIRRLEREANIIADLPRIYGQRNFSLSASTGERAGVRCRSPQFPKPEEYRFYKGDPNNEIQPVSKQALNHAIKKCHQTLWAGGKLSPPAAFGEHRNIAEINSGCRVPNIPHTLRLIEQSTCLPHN
jgi:type I restriction enzyme M protein